ncbi:MAG: hypothetical protein WB392_14515 [Methanotrichaceae archaeon]
MEAPQFVSISMYEYQQIIAAVQEISSLRADLESTQERFARDLAEDRQRISKLEDKPLEPRNRDRGEVLAALIIKNGGAISRQEARKLMRLSESQFSQLLNVSKDFIKIGSSRLDKRIKILSLK